MKRKTGALALIFLSLMVLNTSSNFQRPNVGLHDPVIDFWAVTHFLAGATVLFMSSFLLSLPNGLSDYGQSIPGLEYKLTISVIIAWEVYELIENPWFWSSIILNNLMDVAFGLIGLKYGLLVTGWIPPEIPGE